MDFSGSLRCVPRGELLFELGVRVRLDHRYQVDARVLPRDFPDEGRPTAAVQRIGVSAQLSQGEPQRALPISTLAPESSAAATSRPGSSSLLPGRVIHPPNTAQRPEAGAPALAGGLPEKDGHVGLGPAIIAAGVGSVSAVSAVSAIRVVTPWLLNFSSAVRTSSGIWEARLPPLIVRAGRSVHQPAQDQCNRSTTHARKRETKREITQGGVIFLAGRDPASSSVSRSLEWPLAAPFAFRTTGGNSARISAARVGQPLVNRVDARHERLALPMGKARQPHDPRDVAARVVAPEPGRRSRAAPARTPRAAGRRPASRRAAAGAALDNDVRLERASQTGSSGAPSRSTNTARTRVMFAALRPTHPSR